jgi:DMSO reductase anchor subunit
MNMREWALVTFTVLGQMAAGGLLVLMIIRSYVSKRGTTETADRLLDGPLFMIVPIMGLALLASLLHLNNPVNIFKAVPNLGSSWLTREVSLAVTFIVVAAVYTFLQWRKIGGNDLREVIGWIGALVGVVQIYAMSQVYMIPTQPAWDTLATPVTFFVTGLMLGTLAVAAGLATNHAILQKKASEAAAKQLELSRESLQGIAVASIILLGIQFLVLPIYMAYLATQGPAGLETVKLMIVTYGDMLAFRLLLVFVGAGLLAAVLYRSASSASKEKVFTTLTYSAFLLVFVAEVMGRFLFYATRVRIGL